jgi:hypothetical protein
MSAEMAEARGWLIDCGRPADGLTYAQVRQQVDREYAGGWTAFLVDADPSGGQ